jgi:hypothetical protein
MSFEPRDYLRHILVEADYRMKLIGIGLEQPPVRMASYVDRASPSQVSRNAMERLARRIFSDCASTASTPSLSTW